MWKNVSCKAMEDFLRPSVLSVLGVLLASPTCFDSGLLETSNEKCEEGVFKTWLKFVQNKASPMRFKISIGSSH